MSMAPTPGPVEAAAPQPTPQKIARDRRHSYALLPAVLLVVALIWLQWTVHPVGFMFDPNKDKCLPDLHLSFTVKGLPKHLGQGDLVYWKPAGALAYVKQEFVLKQVAAVPGDHLQIADDRVLVNGREVTRGLALVNVYKTTVQGLQRDEIVPPAKVFMVGYNRLSDDSRYWGYLDTGLIVGQAHKIW